VTVTIVNRVGALDNDGPCVARRQVADASINCASASSGVVAIFR
jgi:hypothetical protein